MKKLALSMTILIVSMSNCSFAQFFDRLSNPTIIVTLKHPPILGIKVNKVAFGVADGNCSDQVTDAIKSDFVSNGIEVIDRENLKTIFAEQNLTLSGSIDATSAAKIGKILGPSAYIIVKVQRCSTFVQTNLYKNETKHDYNKNIDYNVINHIARTTADLKVSIQTIDLTTGRTFTATQLSYTPVKENTSYDGIPVAPLESEVQDVAFANAVSDVHKLFLEWSERRKVVFFDDKKGGLKDAYRALQEGDLDKTLEISRQNVRDLKDDDKAKDKTIGHAYYNLALAYMLKENYDKAIKFFNRAEEFHGGEIVRQAITDCNKALALKQEVQKVDQKAAVVIEKQKAEVEIAKKTEETNKKIEETNTLTNDEVIKMVKQKLSEVIIIQKIKKSKCNFNTTADGLGTLSQSGVSDNIITAMIDKQ